MNSGDRKRSAANSSNPGCSRSVVDYDTEDQLRKALMAVEGCSADTECASASASMLLESEEGQPVQKTARTGEKQSYPAEHLDWVLPSCDPDTTEAQSMQEELKRLQVLKSYLILGVEREEAFERITALAARIFGVPIALVSLVDLGRQWFMSNRGLGDVRETPRKLAFCAHAILNKNNILVVPDASLDFRFCKNPLVTGPPNIRFYAGAPLISPEGYKLGTFCIIDSVARPNGLSTEEISTLNDLAAIVVKQMVDRRAQLERRKDPAQLIAYTAHDLMTPLTGVHLSLSLLKDDDKVKVALGENQMELLNTAASCSDLMIRICQNALDGLRQSESGSATPNSAAVPNAGSGPGFAGNSIPMTKMEDLVKSLHMIVEPVPKRVPCIITLDKDVPSVIVGDDLKLFRSALNLLTNALDRTDTGIVRLTIRPDQDSLLLFECEDTGADIPVEQYQYLFQPGHSDDGNFRVGLSSISSLINSLDGEYGFRSRGTAADGSILTDCKGRRRSGSIFWFSIPLCVPESVDVAMGTTAATSTSAAAAQPSGVIRHVGTNYSSVRIAPLAQQLPSFSVNKTNPLVVGDVIQAGATIHGVGLAAWTKAASCDEILANLAKKTSIAANNTDAMEEDRKMPGVTCDEILANLAKQTSIAANNNDVMEEDRKMPARMENNVEPFPLPDAVPPGNVPGIRKRRALVIEDSLVVRKSLAHALKRLGFDVAQAVDGMEGVQELKMRMFDIVLCDFLMPVMDGLDCVKQYRDWEKQNRPWYSQLIIGISAHANMNDSGQGIQAGMDDFRPKPISIRTLTELQGSEEAIMRTRKLDEWEKSACRANLGDGAPTERDSQPLSLLASSVNAIVPNALPTGGPAAESVCLIATDIPTMHSNQVPQVLESMGWKVVVVHDGTDCLRLLQMRNWNAVLIDDDLPRLAGVSCVTAFRKWEEQNRVNGQKNVFLVCDGEIPSPSDKSSLIQPPFGCNGVLRKPVPVVDLQFLLHQSGVNCAMDIVVRGRT